MKQAFINLAQAEALASRYPTPFHLYDERGIRANARLLHEAFAWNKGFKEYFAVKATPNPRILQILHEEGCGLDCSSYTELLMAERCGFSGEEIMFSSNDTPAKDFRLAAQLGATINLDDISHIDFLEAEIGRLPETLSCRLNPGGVFAVDLANGIMDKPGEAKYGMTRAQLSEAFRRMKAKGVRRFGIHAFLVSNATGNAYYPKLAELLFRTAVELHEECGVEVAFVNLSGGIGVPYRPEQEGADILAIGEAVRRAYEAIIVPAGLDGLALYTELGRFMLAPYGLLLTRVLHKKDIHKQYVGVDACAADLMRPAMYGAYHHITVLGKEKAPCDRVYDVTGGLCENNDKFAVDRSLPEIECGDLLAIHDTGAHGYAMGYNYNGKLRSAEVLLRADGGDELIRRAETPADYFATFDFTGLFEGVE